MGPAAPPMVRGIFGWIPDKFKLFVILGFLVDDDGALIDFAADADNVAAHDRSNSCRNQQALHLSHRVAHCRPVGRNRRRAYRCYSARHSADPARLGIRLAVADQPRSWPARAANAGLPRPGRIPGRVTLRLRAIWAAGVP